VHRRFSASRFVSDTGSAWPHWPCPKPICSIENGHDPAVVLRPPWISTMIVGTIFRPGVGASDESGSASGTLGRQRQFADDVCSIWNASRAATGVLFQPRPAADQQRLTCGQFCPAMARGMSAFAPSRRGGRAWPVEMGQKWIPHPVLLERHDSPARPTTATRSTDSVRPDRRTACTADDNVSMDHKTPKKAPLPVFPGKG
jgi:hypothetical protein